MPSQKPPTGAGLPCFAGDAWVQASEESILGPEVAKTLQVPSNRGKGSQIKGISGLIEGRWRV